jgi:hypothetical protein
MLIPFGILGASGAGLASSYELISTTVLGSTSTSVTFSNLGTYSSTYKHLQIRYTARSIRSIQWNYTLLITNGDTGNNRWHGLGTFGNSAAVQSQNGSGTGFITGYAAGANTAANIYSGNVIDILDYSSTTKTKTFRTLAGIRSNLTGNVDHHVALYSGLWNSTAAITSIALNDTGGWGFTAGSRFSLYGIKG